MSYTTLTIQSSYKLEGHHNTGYKAKLRGLISEGNYHNVTLTQIQNSSKVKHNMVPSH